MTGADTDRDLPGYNEGDPSILDFTTPDKTDARPWKPVTVDGHLCMVREPKTAFWGLMADLEDASPVKQFSAAYRVLDTIFDPDSGQHLRERLLDEDDDFDLDEFGAILERLQEHWSGRPTSRRGASTRPASPRGKRSTARAR